jgi:hypothetical protein
MRRSFLFALAALLLTCASARAQNAVWPYPGSSSVSVIASSGHQVSLLIAPPTNIYGVSLGAVDGYNSSASTRWIMTFPGSCTGTTCTTVCPATGTVPIDEELAAATSMWCLHGGFNEWYPGGVAICVSTTEGTFTAEVTATNFIHAQIIK